VLFQPIDELFPELGDLGRNHVLVVRLKRIAREIPLVKILRRIELRSGRDLGDDAVGVEPNSCEFADDLFGCLLLLWTVMEYRRTVLSTDVVSLSIQSRRIVDHEEHLQDLPVGITAGSKVT
jgi:hypothetical protein